MKRIVFEPDKNGEWCDCHLYIAIGIHQKQCGVVPCEGPFYRKIEEDMPPKRIKITKVYCDRCKILVGEQPVELDSLPVRIEGYDVKTFVCPKCETMILVMDEK